jgi:uncharacterized tellurite resistance protein B-like protein
VGLTLTVDRKVTSVKNGQQQSKKGEGDMAKKSSGIEGVAIVIGLVVVGIASVPKEVWIGIGVFAAIAFALYHYRKAQESKPAVGADRTNEVLRPFVPPEPRSSASQFTPVSEPKRAPRWDDAPTFVAPKSAAPQSYSVPTPPKGYGPGVWIAAGNSITVAGQVIPGGMLYFGTSLKTPIGENDPGLIDPSKTVATRGDYTLRQTDYWPSYSTISDSARRAYLNWLAGGKKDPEANIGYVFLYFYGLERRAILDAARRDGAEADYPLIEAELKRLLSIYGDKSDSFRRYASELLVFVELADFPEDIYLHEIPDLPRSWDVPAYIKLALGKASLAGVPVPGHLALAWVRSDPNTFLRTPATRCAAEFAKLFKLKYAESFGSGIVLPKNKTKLKLVYRPASSGFNGLGEISRQFGDTPDVTALTAPMSKLRALAEAATKELDGYSRYLGRSPDAGTSLVGLLQLPAHLWPDVSRRALEGLKVRASAGDLVISYQELLVTLGAKGSLTRDQVLGLAGVLESMNIGIEPDVLGGAGSPKPTSEVVLFSVPLGEHITRTTPTYQAALHTLQLGAAVATADGEFASTELTHLRKQVESWSHLTPSHRQRLLAHLTFLTTAPVSLTSLKKKLEPLTESAKETIAAFASAVAQADGTVSPAEVKMLEKVYKALGVDPKKVFGDLHAAASGTAVSQTVPAKAEGFKLDAARIASLQRDSERVSALLAGIFTEDDSALVATPVPVVVEQPDEPVADEGLMGLDEVHSTFVRMLLSRPQWSRSELLDVAEDLELMLDGALEHINEASFDKYDAALTEGEDPIEVRAEILEKIEA